MRKRTTNLILSIVCLTLILLTLTPLFLAYCLGPKITRRILEQKVETILQKKVEVERAGITVFRGFGIEYKNLRILGSDGNEHFRAEAFLLKPWIKSLLRGRLKWKSIALQNPTLDLIRTSQGHIDLLGKISAKTYNKEAGLLHGLRDIADQLPSHLSVRAGRIRLTDLSLSQSPVVTAIEDLDLTSQTGSSKTPFSFLLTGRFIGGSGEEFSLSGDVTYKEVSLDREEREFVISLGADNLDTQQIWPYVRTAVPLTEMEGFLDLKITCTGVLTRFHSSGEMRIRRGRFVIPKLYRTALEPGETSLQYELDYDKERIHISRLALRAPHISVSGSGKVRGITDGNPLISLEFGTEKTSLEHIGPYLPDQLVPKRLLALLTDPRIQGAFRVEKATLQGPWSGLTYEGLKKNPEMLSVQARLDNCTLVVGSKLPPFRNVSGVFTLQGNKADIKGFRGQLLRCHLPELNGAISRIYSNPKMFLTLKGDLDLKRLLSVLKAKEMPTEVRKAFDPIRTLSGQATVAGEIRYAFNKLSDLTYKSKISLKRTRVNMAGLAFPLTHMEGEIRCDEKEILLSQFKWRMGKGLCRGRASFRRYLKKSKAKLALSKNMEVSFDMNASEIDFDDFLSPGRKKKRGRIDPESAWANSAILAKVTVGKGFFRGFRFENLETSFVVKRGLLRFRCFRAEAPGGFMRCRGWVNLKSKRMVSFKLIPEVHHLDIMNMMRIFTPKGRRVSVSGRLSLEGMVTGGGSSMDSVISSLGGDLRLRAETGIIRGSNTSEQEGLPYERVTAQIMIDGGIASTEDLLLDSDVMSMTMKGRADLNKRTLDLLIGVRPLQTMDRILSNIPVAGWLLAGKDRSILTFFYRVRGPFDDVRVESRKRQDARPGGP